MINAKIVADSKNTLGNRLTTMVVTFPRYILAELNTHRLFSRNSASSRAIPFKKMVQSVRDNPFVPIAWQKDHSGMQGNDYFTGTCSEDLIQHDRAFGYGSAKDVKTAEFFTNSWLATRDYNILEATHMHELGVTKQLVNRLLEPFMWHTVLITSSEWDNFFNLRCPSYVDEAGNVYKSKRDFVNGTLDPTQAWMMDDSSMEWFNINQGQAEIHMMALAEAMWDAINESTPVQLQPGEYHIPFGDNINIYDWEGYDARWTDEEVTLLKIKIACARCARVSYTVVGEEGKPANYENDIKLYDRLLKSGHMSPFEHVGKAMSLKEYMGHIHTATDYNNPEKIGAAEHGWSGNFRGFIQHRKTIE